jgi:hypothetical protein
MPRKTSIAPLPPAADSVPGSIPGLDPGTGTPPAEGAGIELVCVLPFHGYAKGQRVTDPHLVADLLKGRDHHFVKVAGGSVAGEPAPSSTGSM